MNEQQTEKTSSEAPKIDTSKIIVVACLVIAAYLMIAPRLASPSRPVAEVAQPTLSIDQTTMQEAKTAPRKQKSIRENLARAKQVMAGFEEIPGEEPVDRMTRLNKYILEATKEDVKSNL